MTPTRVLHVLDHSLPHVTGYSVRSHSILRAQVSNGIAPVVLTSPKHGVDAADHCIDGLTYQRAPARRIDPLHAIPGVSDLKLIQRLRTRLTRIVREQPVDLIHAHSPALTGIAALSVARRAGVPLVYEIRAFWEDATVAYRGLHPRSIRYRLTRALETWLLRRVDAVGVISNGLARDVIERGIPAHKVFLVPNGVDTERFQPMERDDALVRHCGLDGQTVFGFIGTIHCFEGLDVLLQAMAAMRSQAPAVRALLIGDGPEYAQLRAEVDRLGIASRVSMMGEIPHADIRRWYSVCDAMVYPRHPSRLTELTTPLKPLEAMAMGKAVVGSNVGGLRELIHDEDTGLLFPADDSTALADRLTRLARDPDLRSTLGQRARRFVCVERQWQHTAHAAIATYRKLLTGGPELVTHRPGRAARSAAE